MYSHDEREFYYDFIAKDISQGGRIFGTNVVKTFDIDDYQKGIEERETNASDGKILLKVWE